MFNKFYNKNGIRILAYHLIDDHYDTPLDYIRTDIDTFKKQIDYLLNNKSLLNRLFNIRWKSVNLREFFNDSIDINKNDRLFHVTFDDGLYKEKGDQFFQAVKYCLDNNIYTTLYLTRLNNNKYDRRLIYGKMDEYKALNYDDCTYLDNYRKKNLVYLSMMFNTDIDKIEKYLNIQYHTKNHKDLTKIDKKDIFDEIDNDYSIENWSLCIPFGKINNSVKNILNDYFSSINYGVRTSQDIGIITMEDGCDTKKDVLSLDLYNNKYTTKRKFKLLFIRRLQVTGTRGFLDFLMKVYLGYNIRYRIKKLLGYNKHKLV